MSRPFYSEVENGIFHVTSRGNARQRTYFDDRDYRRFVGTLQRTVKRHEWRCLSYCLMPNHFHLLVQTPKPTLADGVRDLKSTYARALHLRYDRDGSLYKKGFHRQLVSDDSYLLAAAVYVARNPIRAGLAPHPLDWPWSSFEATVSGRSTFVDAGLVLGQLSSDAQEGRVRFLRMVEGEDIAPTFDPSRPIVGDKAFVEHHAPNERPGRDVVKAAWEQARPSLIDLSDGCCEREFVRRARVEQNYTLREIAVHLECSEQTVRRRLSDGGTRLL